METQRIVEFPHHNLDKRPRSAWDVPDHVIPHPKKFVDYGSEEVCGVWMLLGYYRNVYRYVILID
ncbi:hypothetical protein HanLR1_Chr11g0422911 [Helianthus annuus]|nr:hypothetical protein HanLR1_Chr11g0422911 [Helianthus annuus]